MEKQDQYVPLSESSVSHKLSQIQKRCSEFLDAPETLELSLEEPADGGHDGNPYNRG